MFEPNIKEQLIKGYMNESEILLSLRTNQNKTFKSHLEGNEAALCYLCKQGEVFY